MNYSGTRIVLALSLVASILAPMAFADGLLPAKEAESPRTYPVSLSSKILAQAR
jgi:hypothetical protein